MSRLLNGCGLLLLSAMAERTYAQQPVCTIVPPLAPQRILPPGGPVTVTANCTGTPFFCGVSFPGWRANGVPVAACDPCQFTQTLTTTITSTTTFTLSVQNAAGTSVPLAVTVEVGSAATAPAAQVTTPQAVLAVATPVAQLDNIRQRLDNLRARRNPAVTEGLKVSYNGQALPPFGAFSLAPADVADRPVPPRGGGASADQDPFERYGVYVVGDLGIGKVSGTSTQSGFDFRSYGISLGADYRFAGNHTLGAALGLVKANSDVAGNGGTQDAKGYSFSVYGSIVPVTNAYIDLVVNYGSNKYDGTRRVTDPALPATIEYTSSPGGNQFGAAASFGYQFYREALTLAPYGRVEYVLATVDAFQESGGPGALQVGSQRYKATLLSLGGQASYAISMPWGVLMPYVRAEYQYQAATSAKAINAQLVLDPAATGTVPTSAVDKSYGNFALGASLVCTGGLSAFFNYQHLFGKDNFDDNRYTLGLRFDF